MIPEAVILSGRDGRDARGRNRCARTGQSLYRERGQEEPKIEESRRVGVLAHREAYRLRYETVGEYAHPLHGWRGKCSRTR